MFQRAKDILTNPEKFKYFMSKNKKEVTNWGIFISAILFIYFFFSSGDFSFFLTLSGFIQLFGFTIILSKIYQTRTVSGVSKNSMILYTILLFFRTVSCLIFEGYLPLDKTGDWFYQIVEISSFGISLGVLYLMVKKYSASYNADLDSIKFYYILPVTFILACFFHPSLNNNSVGDIAWTFSLYTESGGEIESFTSNFVASQGLSRLLCFIFWIFTFDELNDVTEFEANRSASLTPKHSGYGVLIAQIIQLLLMGDFFWQYIKSIRTGMPMSLPIYNL